MNREDRVCRCRFGKVGGLKGHEPGCPMLQPPAPVPRDPRRLEHPVAAVTGGEAPMDLTGLPAAIGVEIPLTHRVGDYLAQPRMRECGVCHVVDIPFGVDWPYWHEGKPVHQACYPFRKLGRLTLSALSVVPTRTREGDQPLPTDNGGPAMQDLVIADIEARKAVGLSRYGQLLKAFDGRDNLRDIYEELLDAAVYVRKEIYKRDGK